MQFHEESLGTYPKSNYTAQKRNLKGAPALVSSLRSKVDKFAKRTTLFLAGRIPQRPLFILLAVLSFFHLSAESYTFGGKKGWSDVTVRNGITTGKGRFGYESLELDTNQSKVQDSTDLLIDFEDSVFYDKSGNYEIVKNHAFKTTKSVRGKGAALCRNRGGIVLRGNEQSFFGNESPVGSFLIDFWICPATVDNGEVILNWRSSRILGGQIVYQVINLSFYQNKVMLVFSNIFDGYTENNGEIDLTTIKSLIPNKWTHHVIKFIEETGSLEYRLDGELECLKYVTDNGHETGTVFPAVMGNAADFELCPSYTGLIDDFMILRTYADVLDELDANSENSMFYEHYVVSGGRFESQPIMFKQGTTINKLFAETDNPPQTDVHFYVRGGENYFNWTKDYPEWIQVNPDAEIENLTGMYFQVAAELFPDGAGKNTPSVTSITLDYSVLPEPLPPVKIRAEKGDGSVTLTWSYSIEDTAGGYYIYYGNRPGEYLGRVAAEGHSPIDAGNVTSFTLTGLTNGTIYYFAVAAYSKIDSRIVGPLSKEVYARPAVR